MYNTPYGYGSGAWQGFQPGKSYPQQGYPSPQFQQPNQPYTPTSAMQWSPTPISPMMHPAQYSQNYAGQPPAPGTGGYFNYNQASNYYPPKMPPVSPSMQTSFNNHTFPGQSHTNQPPTTGYSSSVPAPMNQNYPISGQANYTGGYAVNSSYPTQNSQPSHSAHSFSSNFGVPGNVPSYSSKPPLPASNTSSVINPPLPPEPSKPPLPSEKAPTPLLLSHTPVTMDLDSPSTSHHHTTSSNHCGAKMPDRDKISNSKTPNQDSRDSLKLNKTPEDCGSSSSSSHSRTSTKKDQSSSHHSSKSMHESNRGRRAEQDKGGKLGERDMKRREHTSLKDPRLENKRRRQESESDKSPRDTNPRDKSPRGPRLESKRRRQESESNISPRDANSRDKSPRNARLESKRRRQESESNRRVEDEIKSSSRSSDYRNGSPRIRHDTTPHKDKHIQHNLGRSSSFSKDEVNRQIRDEKGAGTQSEKRSETTNGRDCSLRCVSPPPPNVNRKIKFIVPEDYYRLTKDKSQGNTIVTATQTLQKVHASFEKKIFSPTTKPIATRDKDTPCLTTEATNTSKTAEHRPEDDTFDLDSLDGSEFDLSEKKYKGEYTADSFANNDDSDDDSDGDDDDDDDDEKNDADVSDCSISSDGECEGGQEVNVQEIRNRKIADPRRLHTDLWFNEKGEGNDGPVCKCCPKDKERGIRHGVYPGEKEIPLCNPLTNNPHKLHHYWVTITPHCNFMTERPSVIRHKDKDYVFEGFSLISHESLDWIPKCTFIRFNIEYTIHLVREPLPKNFCVKGLDLFSKYLFSDILELCDWSLKGENKECCPIFHFMPRYLIKQKDQKGAKEVYELLSMDKVLAHLIRNASDLLIKPHHLNMPKKKERPFVKSHYNAIVTKPNKKPAAFRIDDILFENESHKKKGYPLVLHHGIRPVQMSYAGNPQYQKLWKSYLRLRSAISSKPVTSRKDHDRLVEMKVNLERMRLKSSMRRDIEVRVSSQDLRKTGINSDVCQHAMVLPVIVHHIRYHMCLKKLDSKLGYNFKDRSLLQLALTHPSYHLNFGMNPDQARNTLTNCGVKLPRYGDRKIHRMNTKKKGITQLIRIMANLGKLEENQSMIRHNERLEFLGDAVLEFICSTQLFYMLPENNEGDLAMYRSALVQNSHLAALAKSFNLSDYMQYSHGPDLCKQEDLDHAMANCFEAILGAIFIEGGLQAASDFFTRTAFRDEKLRRVWITVPKHPLQIQEPTGDRHLIPASPVLQQLQEFEESTGITFNHIRLLARAFTHPQVGFNNLTLGDNQRMEFLGDSVLQFIVSIYLYRHFPEHHEGHLTLLRSSLVNNHTQADVSRQLRMDKYINFGSKEIKNIREKLLADVLEAFLAALYIDKGLKHVEVFCRIYFFPRVEENIVNQEWIDSKSQLQQCCLALREEGKQPDLPIYKVLQNAGPSHQKKFQVAVYYKGKRVGTGEGQSMHLAEMAAAKDALTSSYFPEMARQKHLLDVKHQEKRTRKYEPSKPREKPTTVDTSSPKEPQWVEDE